MANEQLDDLLRQVYEVEQGGAAIYETALRGVEDEDLRDEWERHVERSRERATIVRELLQGFNFDPAIESPARLAARQLGESFMGAMKMALASGTPGAAQLIAAAYVVFAETKGDEWWDLIRVIAGKLRGQDARALQAAYERVAKREDEQLYYTAGLNREL